MQRNLKIMFAAMLLALVTGLPSNAQTLPAEDDTWITGGGTQVNFADFGNLNLGQMLGSVPNSTTVSFNGVPLNSALGLADTLVSRGPATVASSFSATLSLKGLSLVSSPDLTLHDGRTYHITVGLASQSGTGQINFTTTSAEGGTYTSTFTVTPIFTLTNINNPAEPAHVINCATDPNFTCSFPINGSGSWVLTSSTGFDPQSQGIPIVPSGVTVGGYTTVGHGRSGGMQVGCGGTKSAGYGCGQNNELHGQGSLGQAIHGTKPPNDCAAPPPAPAPSPTPVPGPPTGGSCSATMPIGVGGCNALQTQPTQPIQSVSLCAARVQ